MRKPLFLSTEIYTRACKEREVIACICVNFCFEVHTICGCVLAQKGVPFLSEVTTLPPTLLTVLFPTSFLHPLSYRIKRRLSLRFHYQHSCEQNGSKGRKEHNDVRSVAYPGIFFGGGVQQIQLRTERMGILGVVNP